MREHKAGLVAFVGRPNVGKSTLINAMVGERVAIVSDKPQTTRKAIYGVVKREEGQIAIVDTPGIHRPKTLLGTRLNRLAQETMSLVDTVVLCFPADQKIGPGDKFILERVKGCRGVKKVAVITKIDLVEKSVVVDKLLEIDNLEPDWEALVPVSAVEDFQLITLERVIFSTFASSPPLSLSHQEPLEEQIAELIRESALSEVKQELPHSTAVKIEEIIYKQRKGQAFADIYANIYVERDSQKAIILGCGGKKIKKIAAMSRAKIEKSLGHQVYLSVRVKTLKNWQENSRFLKRLGF